MAQALAVRSSGADGEAAWTAGLVHNLADYLDSVPIAPAQAADWLTGLDPGRLAGRRGALSRRAAGARTAAHPLVRLVHWPSS